MTMKAVIDNIVIYDVGSTYTKLTLMGKRGGRLVHLGRSQCPTTVEGIHEGLQTARESLGELAPLARGGNTSTLATSSAAGGLRMVAMGYMPKVTAKAAKEVAMNAGARVLEILSHEELPDYKVEVLREISPDLILLAGGTDGGDCESIIESAQLVARSGVHATVIIAGNVEGQEKAGAILDEHSVYNVRVANLLPTIHELNVEPSRQAIHHEFIRQITRAKGLRDLLDEVTNGEVMPTPGAVLVAAELLAKGTYETEGMGDLIIVDIGGATTDIHSVLPSALEIPDEERGLVVSNDKQLSHRTVEGNLGMRISAHGVVEALGPRAVLKTISLEGPEWEERFVEYATFLEAHPEHLATSREEVVFDEALAISAIATALRRHAGYLATEYDPVMGTVPGTPVGRDLRGVKYVIGVGGIFAHSAPERAERIIRVAMAGRGPALLPCEAVIMVDGQYLLYALGALADHYPDETLIFAKEYLQNIRSDEK